jgi:hypothetical protein
MQGQVTVGPAIATELALLHAVPDAAPVLFTVVDSSPTAVILGEALRPASFVSTADLLNVHHRLRC